MTEHGWYETVLVTYLVDSNFKDRLALGWIVSHQRESGLSLAHISPFYLNLQRELGMSMADTFSHSTNENTRTAKHGCLFFLQEPGKGHTIRKGRLEGLSESRHRDEECKTSGMTSRFVLQRQTAAADSQLSSLQGWV